MPSGPIMLLGFMEGRVMPAEAMYTQPRLEADDPHAEMPVMEALKELARGRRLWNGLHWHEGNP
jgi:acyl-CoA dehydrogenase